MDKPMNTRYAAAFGILFGAIENALSSLDFPEVKCAGHQGLAAYLRGALERARGELERDEA